MKKRGAKRTKHTKHNRQVRRSKNFFFDNRKLFVVGVAFFLVFAFLLTVASVPQNVTYTGHSVISDFFTNWNAGNLDINIAKYLFWIIILLLIFSALKFASFPENGFLQFLIALVVSFLATAFITPQEVFVMLTSYSALGLTLGSILPFVIIMFFSAMLVSNEKISQMSLAKTMLEVVIWFMWVGFLVYRFIKLWVEQGTIATLFQGGGIVMIVVFFLSLIILIFNRKFREWIRNLGIELIRARERTMAAGEAARERSRREVHEAGEGWGPVRSRR